MVVEASSTRVLGAGIGSGEEIGATMGAEWVEILSVESQTCRRVSVEAAVGGLITGPMVRFLSRFRGIDRDFRETGLRPPENIESAAFIKQGDYVQK